MKLQTFFIFCLFIFSFQVKALDASQASAACTAAKPVNTAAWTYSCVYQSAPSLGAGVYIHRIKATNNYDGSINYGAYWVVSDACPSGQDVNSSGLCEMSCPENQQFIDGSCQTLCTSIGVDVNAFVAKCSQMIPGAPSSCLNDDHTSFALQGCPTLNCPDGSTTVYPTPCPVDSCPAGFTLSDVAGVGKTCVMPLPDNENKDPCINVSGSPDPLCAEPGKNCQLVNGVFVCLKEEITPPADATCYSINSKNYCLSNQPVIGTHKQTVTNPDGSTTTTETQTPSVQGSKPSTKTTTVNPDGSVTTQSTFPSDVASSLGLQQQPTIKIDLSKVEKNTKDTSNNTKDISDNTKGILDNLTDFTQVPDGFNSYDQSQIEFDGLDASLQADRDQFQGFVNQVNSMKSFHDANPFGPAISSMLPSDTSCTGGIHTVIFGNRFDFEPCEKLAPLREILAWFFSFMTVWQIINMTSKSIVRF